MWVWQEVMEARSDAEPQTGLLAADWSKSSTHILSSPGQDQRKEMTSLPPTPLEIVTELQPPDVVTFEN